MELRTPNGNRQILAGGQAALLAAFALAPEALHRLFEAIPDTDWVRAA